MKRIKISIFKWCVISCLFIYLGFMMGKFQKDILEHQVKLSQMEVISLNAEKTELIENLNLVQADLSAEQKINDVLKSENKKLDDALQSSNDKLYFYEQVVAPELAQVGLNIYSFKVSKTDVKGVFSYEVVLMQAQKGRSELTGNVEIMFADSSNDEAENKVVKLSEYSETFESQFKFEYFQTLTGTFTLPKDLQVEQVFVVASAKRSRFRSAQDVEKVYDWQDYLENDTSPLAELVVQAE
ncbi:DUF6776 family protein [Psychromonas aquatilis]|uniref:DUF6776 family protein n=1 Tax=Psychromonas aquatilis TaxID=2005072 RepID=A0ABU9GS31_9GAMM